MTDLDKRWEEFHKDLDSEGVSKASASGALEAMDAKLNQMAVKLDELNEKISEAAAPPEMPPGMDMMGGAPPMPPEAAGGMPPGGAPMPPEGAPADMPPDAAGGVPPEMIGGAPPMPPEAAGGVPPEMMGGAPPMGNGPVPSLMDLLGGGDVGEQGVSGKDPTLDALQNALSSAADPEVIRNLAEILLDYSDKMEQKAQEEEMAQQASPAGVLPPELAALLGGAEAPVAPAENIPPELLTGALGVAPEAIADEGGEVTPNIGASGQPANLLEALLATTASDGNTKVSELNPIKKADKEDETKIPKEEVVEEVRPEKKDDASKEPMSDENGKDAMALVIDIASDGDTRTESEGEQAVTDTANCPFKALEDNPEIMNMTLGEIILSVKKGSAAPEKDPNMFIHGGEPTDSVTACAGSDLRPVHKSVARSFEEDLDYFGGNPFAGREDYYEPITRSLSEEDQLREMIASIVKSYTLADAIADVTVGEALDTISLIKSAGVPDTERRFVDTLDLIARYTDSIGGEAATEQLMKSKGIDINSIFTSTGPVTKAGNGLYKVKAGRSMIDPANLLTMNNNPQTLGIIKQILIKRLRSIIAASKQQKSLPAAYAGDKYAKLVGDLTDSYNKAPTNDPRTLIGRMDIPSLAGYGLKSADLVSIANSIINDARIEEAKSKNKGSYLLPREEAPLKAYQNYLEETKGAGKDSSISESDSESLPYSAWLWNIITDASLAQTPEEVEDLIQRSINRGFDTDGDIENFLQYMYGDLSKILPSKENVNKETGDISYAGGVLDPTNGFVDSGTGEFITPRKREMIKHYRVLEALKSLDESMDRKILGSGLMTPDVTESLGLINKKRKGMLDLGYHGKDKNGSAVTNIDAGQVLNALGVWLPRDGTKVMTPAFKRELALAFGLDPNDEGDLARIPDYGEIYDFMRNNFITGRYFDRSKPLYTRDENGNVTDKSLRFLKRLNDEKEEYTPKFGLNMTSGDLFDMILDSREPSKYKVGGDLIRDSAGRYHRAVLSDAISPSIVQGSSPIQIESVVDGVPQFKEVEKNGAKVREPVMVDVEKPWTISPSFIKKYHMFFKDGYAGTEDDENDKALSGNGIADFITVDPVTKRVGINTAMLYAMGHRVSDYYDKEGKPVQYLRDTNHLADLLSYAPDMETKRYKDMQYNLLNNNINQADIEDMYGSYLDNIHNWIRNLVMNDPDYPQAVQEQQKREDNRRSAQDSAKKGTPANEVKSEGQPTKQPEEGGNPFPERIVAGKPTITPT